MVIMSHGFNGCGDDFKEYAKILTKNEIGVLTYDFCGGSLHSKSDLSTTEMTVFTAKEDLLAVIDFVTRRHTKGRFSCALCFSYKPLAYSC